MISYNEIFKEFLAGNLRPVDDLLALPVKELKIFAKDNSLTFRSKKQFRAELITWLKVRKGIECEIIRKE